MKTGDQEYEYSAKRQKIVAASDTMEVPTASSQASSLASTPALVATATKAASVGEAPGTGAIIVDDGALSGRAVVRISMGCFSSEGSSLVQVGRVEFMETYRYVRH